MVKITSEKILEYNKTDIISLKKEIERIRKSKVLKNNLVFQE